MKIRVRLKFQVILSLFENSENVIFLVEKITSLRQL